MGTRSRHYAEVVRDVPKTLPPPASTSDGFREHDENWREEMREIYDILAKMKN